MKTKITWYFVMGFFLLTQFAFAQQKTITGTVTDNENMPLPGVSVMVRGTTKGAQTDFDGNYSISAERGSTLVLSYIGFKPTEILIGDSDTYDASLQVETGELEEVIVMGYVSKRREDLTGSTVQINSDELQQTPMASVDQALQGKVAGLQISSSSGTPGAVQNIRIRGVSSITAGNEPLYVIDGVPIINTNSATNSAGDALATSSLSPLASLNSNDIESMTVLKDASATAAYGARGSNGVIVITTKSGRSGKTAISVSSYYGFTNNAIDGPEPLSGSQRETLYYEGLMNSYGLSSMAEARTYAVETLGDRAGYGAWNAAGRPSTNWKDVVTNRDATIQEHTISANGGSEDHTFYSSLGFYEQEATVVGADFERISGALNVTQKISDDFEFSSSNTASHSFQDGLLEGSAYFSSPHSAKYFMSPLDQPYNDDGSYNLNTGLPNPLYIAENDIDQSRLTRILSNNTLRWDIPVEGLSFTSRASIDYQVYNYKSYNNRISGDGSDTDGGSFEISRNSAIYVFQNSLDYVLNLGDHNMDFKLLQEYQKYNSRYLSADGDNFVTDGLTNLASAGNPTGVNSQFNDWAVASYLGTASYNYQSRYILNGTYRREANSRFANENRWGNFWSVGAAWNLHRESFLKNNDLLNNLKLRASYGKTGNANIDTNLYQVLFNYDADYAGTGASYPAGYGNEDLSWETSYTFDTGVEFGLFQNRVTGSFAYYRRETEDLLLEVPLSFTTGFSEQTRNVGRMENKGFEAELSVDVVRSNDFNITLGGNIGTVKNEVLEVSLDANGVEIPVTNPNSSYQRSTSGTMVYEWFLPTWAGVDPATGVDTYYTDGVGSEVTTSYTQANRVYQGSSALPTLTSGINLHVDFKGFFLDASGYYAGGHKIYESWHRYLNQGNRYTTETYNGYTDLLDRWQSPGDITRVAKVVDEYQPWTYNSKFLHDGDYFRLRNVTIGYDVNADALANIGVSSARLFVRGTNLYTWVKDDNLSHDPEVDATGFTSITTPPIKSVVFGVNLKF
ncbi:SusC/RagA family TonB-linked outer membrane protein [Flavimarina sp. Hel_I_48]|uniref:SusC/RagA family TonB-linked outer membrane protein n=1 Tax=Flavimarina sp. Hel_I_48 TaxID=1392488 RepID=UPI0004DF7689|nr:SusC/RagA family TonB-linked outer membrane protein [Flavimarina sp. Hel_I_48]